MFSVAIFGGNKVDGSMVEPGERVVGLAMFGGIELDFSGVPPAPAVDMVLIAVFGGVTLKVRPEQQVRLTGFSLFGGRSVDPRHQLPPPPGAVPAAQATSDDEEDLPLEVAAYAFFGGVSVKREAAPA